MCLRAHEPENQLMVGFVQARRIDDVGYLDGIREIEDGDAGRLHPGHVGDDVILGHLTALYRDRAYSQDAVQWRL